MNIPKIPTEEIQRLISENYPTIPSLNPSVINTALRSTDPLFRRIYERVESEDLHFYEINSISIAVYRYLFYA